MIVVSELVMKCMQQLDIITIMDDDSCHDYRRIRDIPKNIWDSEVKHWQFLYVHERFMLTIFV